MTDEDFMRLAIRKAREGITKGQTPFAACIVRNGRVIACEHNLVWRTTDITAHAEITAIRRACARLKTIDLSGCVLYSTCEPCPMCFSACHWARIGTIVYGARIADAKRAGFRELTIPSRTMRRLGKSAVVVKGDVSREESCGLFERWSRHPARRAY